MAVKLEQPLVILHIFSPSDYHKHDRSPRRIDFNIRQLITLQSSLKEKNVPLHTPIYLDRRVIPRKVAELMGRWNSSYLYANVEHEVDELDRDEKIVRASMAARVNGEGWGGQVILLQDHCVIAPGSVSTQVRFVSDSSVRRR
jgi:deoxyribodipyrimidine photo-lyase